MWSLHISPSGVKASLRRLHHPFGTPRVVQPDATFCLLHQSNYLNGYSKDRLMPLWVSYTIQPLVSASFWSSLLSLNIARTVELSWIYFFCGVGGLAEDRKRLFSIWIPSLSSCYSSSVLVLAQTVLVFLIMRLSFSVNHDLRQSDTFPGGFTLLYYTVWMMEQVRMQIYFHSNFIQIQNKLNVACTVFILAWKNHSLDFSYLCHSITYTIMLIPEQTSISQLVKVNNSI